MKSNKISFEPRARLILQLGDQLIRNESIALLEIIKNSYDADASKVTITMKNLEPKENGEIIIEDDGVGMDKNIIHEAWMAIGSDFKKKLFENNTITKKFKRLPIGEKGIGRFGVHKLGKKIEIISRKDGGKEICFNINWDSFEKDKKLSDVKIDLLERTPQYFKIKSGTKITIRNLRNDWKRGNVRELYRAINSLNSPFDSLDSFKVLFKIDKTEWLDDLLSFREIEDLALYNANIEIAGDVIKKLKYEFTPWDTLNKVEARKDEYSNIPMVENLTDPEKKKKIIRNIDLSPYKIGRIHFRIMIFDLDLKILSLAGIDKKGLVEYLDHNGGVRIYRDGIRIYDYGEPGNDWLGLDLKRVNRPTKKLSNNLIIGAIYLKRTDSTELEEKTNREGFIENDAYKEFVAAIDFALGKVLTQRNIDKEKIRKFYGTPTISEPVIGKLRLLYEKISDKNKIKDDELRNELLKTIKEVSDDFESVSEIYTRSSSAGLSLGIVIHELEKIVDELIKMVERYPDKSQIKILVNHLSKIISDYAVVIKQSPKRKENLVELIEQSIFNVTFRLKAHNVSIIKNYLTYRNKTVVNCSANLVVSTIMNLIDNSIWWMNYAKRPKKKIYIDLIENYEGYLSLVIADNGPGFSIPTEYAIKPFITDKPGGMGLGLHLADEVMKASKGKLIFPDKGDVSLLKEFRDGAVIILSFRIN